MKSLNDIIQDIFLPRWVRECDPIEGTSDPTETVVLDETIPDFNVEVFGTYNRPLSDLYGIIKILCSIIKDHHLDTGKHDIIDDDVNNNGLIRESPDINEDGDNDYFQELRKLLLDFYGMDIPDELIPKTYSTTKELAIKIDELFQHLDILRKGLGSTISYFNLLKDFIQTDLDQTGFEKNPYTLFTQSSRYDFKVLKDYAKLWINGEKLVLRGTNEEIDTGSVFLNLSNLSKNSIEPISDLIWLEIKLEKVNTYHVPYGNTQYGKTSYTVLANNTTTEWVDSILEEYNNLFINSNLDLIQFQYKIKTDTFNPEESILGLDSVRTSDNEEIIYSNIRGLWKNLEDSTGEINTLVFPIALITKRNLGVYHKSLNPGGTAIKRTGVSINSVEDCLNYQKIGYFNSETECPNYSSAIYSFSTDTYSFEGTTYYRSGLSDSLVSNNPKNFFADIVYFEDVVYIGKIIEKDKKTSINYITNKIFENEVRNKLSPVFKGSMSLPFNKGKHYSANPIQVLGFGETEEDIFGFDNNGGFFLNETNNGYSGIIDGSRTYWADPIRKVPYSFNLEIGDDNSESRSFLTYEVTEKAITINTTSLSGIPKIDESYPVLYWEDGTEVSYLRNWSGLGTTSAYCKIDDSDRNGQKIYGTVLFNYSCGSGTPFVLDEVIKIEDDSENEVSFCISKSENYCLGCIWYGNPDGEGTETSFLIPDCIDCNYETMEDMWVYVIDSDNIVGEYAQIDSYSSETKEVILKTSFSNTIAETDTLTIGRLKPEDTTVIINPYGRGIIGSYKRKRVQANSLGIYVSDFPILENKVGTLKSSLVTNLASNQFIEIISKEDYPLTTDFYIYFQHNPQWYHFEQPSEIDNFEIIKPGNLIDTTKGSSNEPYNIFKKFVPFSSSPLTETRYLSCGCDDPYFLMKHLELEIGTTLLTDKVELEIIENKIYDKNFIKLSDRIEYILPINIEQYNYRMICLICLVKYQIKHYFMFSFIDFGQVKLTKDNTYFIDLDNII